MSRVSILVAIKIMYELKIIGFLSPGLTWQLPLLNVQVLAIKTNAEYLIQHHSSGMPANGSVEVPLHFGGSSN